MSVFLSRNPADPKTMQCCIESAERKKPCQLRILYMAKLTFQNDRVIKMLPEKQKLRELITTRLALQESQKGFLQDEIKEC